MLLLIMFFVLGIGLFFLHEKKKKLNIRYESEKGIFEITGMKDKFIIKKDENFEFLIEEGRIVACRDKRKSLEFIYYEEEV